MVLNRGLIVFLITLMAFLPSGVRSSSEVTVLVDGQPVKSDVPAQIIDGRTMVPLRFVADALGAKVEWDGVRREVKVSSPQLVGQTNLAGGGIRGIVDKARPSVVGVVNNLPNGSYSTGTGVVLDKTGHVLTNHHVVVGSASIYILISGRMVDAALVGADPKADLAVIKVKDQSLLSEPLSPATWGNSDEVRTGDLAVAVGNPLGFQYQSTVTAGIISGTNRHLLGLDGYYYTLMQTDAAINRGNSGGPLLDSEGRVVGINTLKFSGQGVEGLGFAIPSKIARPISESLIKHGRMRRPWLGVMLKEAEVVKYGVILNSGLTLQEVIENTPASRAGLKTGDILLEVDGQTVNSLPELRTALEVRNPGDTITIKIRPAGGGTAEVKELKVALEERPKD